MADFWWSSWIGAVVPYAMLARLFVDRALSPDEFELLFLRLYKLDPTEWREDPFRAQAALNRLEELAGDASEVDGRC